MRWNKVEVSKKRTFARKSGCVVGAGEEREDSTVKEGRLQGREGGQAKRTSVEVDKA